MTKNTVVRKLIPMLLLLALAFVMGALAGCGGGTPNVVGSKDDAAGASGEDASGVAGSAGASSGSAGQSGAAGHVMMVAPDGSGIAGQPGDQDASGIAGQAGGNDASGLAGNMNSQDGPEDASVDGGAEDVDNVEHAPADTNPTSCVQDPQKYEVAAVPVDGAPGVWSCPIGTTGVVVGFTCCTGCLTPQHACGSCARDEACGSPTSSAGCSTGKHCVSTCDFSTDPPDVLTAKCM